MIASAKSWFFLLPEVPSSKHLFLMELSTIFSLYSIAGVVLARCYLILCFCVVITLNVVTQVMGLKGGLLWF